MNVKGRARGGNQTYLFIPTTGNRQEIWVLSGDQAVIATRTLEDSSFALSF